ncbi:MAG: hypothetical protein V1820_04185 [archaeon]
MALDEGSWEISLPVKSFRKGKVVFELPTTGIETSGKKVFGHTYLLFSGEDGTGFGALHAQEPCGLPIPIPEEREHEDINFYKPNESMAGWSWEAKGGRTHASREWEVSGGKGELEYESILKDPTGEKRILVPYLSYFQTSGTYELESLEVTLSSDGHPNAIRLRLVDPRNPPSTGYVSFDAHPDGQIEYTKVTGTYEGLGTLLGQEAIEFLNGTGFFGETWAPFKGKSPKIVTDASPKKLRQKECEWLAAGDAPFSAGIYNIVFGEEIADFNPAEIGTRLLAVAGENRPISPRELLYGKG